MSTFLLSLPMLAAALNEPPAFAGIPEPVVASPRHSLAAPDTQTPDASHRLAPGHDFAAKRIMVAQRRIEKAPADEAQRWPLEPRRWWFPMLGLHYDRGGDRILGGTTITCDENGENCRETGSQSLDAGEGFELEGGVVLVPIERGPHAIDVQVSAGFKLALVAGSNATTVFRRLPLEALLFYRFNFPSSDWHMRVGAGLAYHASVSLYCSGDAEYYYPSECDTEREWPASPGWVAAAGFVLNGGAVTLRYGRHAYDANDPDGSTTVYTGNYFGIALQWLIGMESEAEKGREFHMRTRRR